MSRAGGKGAGPSDAELVAACRRGEHEAWERLIRRYRRLVYADKIGAWLAMTTRRACWAWSRGDRRFEGFGEGEEETLPDEEPEDVAASLHQVECEHALQLAFRRLEEPCHGLLSALYLEDPRPSYEELSERLGRPIGSLGPTRARCLKKLERLYRQEGGADPILD